MNDRIKTVIRWALPLCLIGFIVSCRYVPLLAEAYARTVYPVLSAVLSAVSSCVPFSLEEVLVVAVIGWMIVLPFCLKRKGGSWKLVLVREVEVLAWIYVWFYLGWGLNYFRYNVYARMQIQPVRYEEAEFRSFLEAYTDSLNAAWLPDVGTDVRTIEQEVKAFYRGLPDSLGLAKPKDYQQVKFFTFTPLYSGVGVLGSMGPFFAEAQLNADLLPVQLPFTYAHEYSHLLGVSGEAEANYWAFRVCTESALPAMRYSGYFGLFPYVLTNAHRLLGEEQFQEWLNRVRPEVRKEYNDNRRYWQERYSPLIGEVQEYAYNLFLKGNKISSGQKNYSEVIGILLSLNSQKAMADAAATFSESTP